MNPFKRLYEEKIGALTIAPDGNVSESTPEHPLVLAGSFNPLHDGHIALLEASKKIVNRPAYFEISVMNVDKPMLSQSELVRRSAQVNAVGESLIVTNAPRFTEKSSLLPGATFVIGLDTYERLLDHRYYPDRLAGGQSVIENSLDLIQENNCRVVVAGRVDAMKHFKSFRDSEIILPARFLGMFTELSESRFRSDLSSTEIRRQSR